MRICRYDGDRVGVVDADGRHLRDASAALEQLAPMRWPLPTGDAFIAALERLREPLQQAAAGSPPVPTERVRLASPVANPSKIVGAPVNYSLHLDEVRAQREIHHDQAIRTIDTVGLFLKSTSSLVGPGDGVPLRFVNSRRNDHEVELAVVIGRRADRVSRDAALAHVAGYSIGLDITVRGPEERSLRKSLDGYSVLGPWLVTADEVPDPANLALDIRVNGEQRQKSNTAALIFDVPRLIEYASSFYTLHPGDVIMTGTPEGVGPLMPGDTMEATVERIGSMTVDVRGA